MARSSRRVAATLLALALVTTGCATRRDDSARIWTPQGVDREAESRWQRSAVGYLASDYLEGRGPGTRGLNLAADYIAEQFRKADIGPVPGYGYFQPFEYITGIRPAESTFLTLGGQTLKLDDDFRPNTVTARDKAFSGEVVFAGYGITSRQHNYDDFANLDLTGKVVLILRYEPRNADGTSRFTNSANWSPEAGLARKITLAQSKGATAVLLVNPPALGETLTEDVLSPFQGRGARGSVTVPVMQVSRAAVDKALASAGTSLASLAAAIDSTGQPASQPLPGLTARGQLDFRPNAIWVRNVIGVLPGKGSLKDEYVVVGAHYDHLGMGGSGSLMPGVVAIHPGADDNASGTTAMMTVAKRLAAEAKRLSKLPDGGPDRRSVLFQAYTVEEQGLIGSQHWVDNPTVPLDRVAYMLNLDMVGRLRNNTLQYGGDGTSEIFDDLLARVYAGTGVTGRSFGRGGIGPSDHASFARKKIPVLFLFTGLHAEYHRPADKPATLNYEGLQLATDIAEGITRELRTAPRTVYNDAADQSRQNVGRADAATPPPAAPAADAPAERVGLGLMPDMSVRERGMRIDGVTPGSAAERAGLKPGDLLLELDGSRIDSVEDLQEVYNRHRPGNTVKAVYERNGTRNETQITFTRRGGPQ